MSLITGYVSEGGQPFGGCGEHYIEGDKMLYKTVQCHFPLVIRDSKGPNAAIIRFRIPSSSSDTGAIVTSPWRIFKNYMQLGGAIRIYGHLAVANLLMAVGSGEHGLSWI